MEERCNHNRATLSNLTDSWRRPSHHLKRPIRIGFVLRSFTFGGAEHDIIQLITASDPRVLQFVGMAVQTPYPICPDLRLDHTRVPRIYQPGAVTRHRKVINANSFGDAVKSVAVNADVLVAWGVPDLAEFVPLDYRGRIVVTSKASGEYQESFLHDNALLTSDYVANSVKSTEAFPAFVRHRAHVIYPGIEQRRVQRTCDRDDQRAVWGFGPDDRLVGYLGRIAPDKGVEQLARSVARMSPQWKAVFVGRNGNFREYERHFAHVCAKVLPGRHAIVDWTTSIGDVLTGFDVLAYPTEDEGFSNTLAEAWLLGVPTVSTAGVGALAEPHWASCAVTISRDFKPNELSRALTVAAGDRQRVVLAKRRARALTVEKTLQSWHRYFTQLAAQPARTRAMVLLPNLVIGGMPSWLLTLMRHTPQIDWSCLCVMSESQDFAAEPNVVDQILSHGCPILGIRPLPVRETKRRLLQAIRQTRPDVVLQCGVKRLDERFPEVDIPLVTISHGPAECTWARDVLTRSARRATYRVAVSEASRDSYASALRPSVSIIPNGVEIPDLKDLRSSARRQARREVGIRNGEIAVGFVGRLSPEKNPQSVAQAMTCLSSRYRAIFIGPDCANLSRVIRRIAPRSRCLGSVAQQTVTQWMPGLDVLVCPSDYESFGLAIVEAWACMVPVVSTRVGVVAELVDDLDVAEVVPFDPEPEVLAAAIRKAIRERRRRIRRCRALARRQYNARRMGIHWQNYLQAIART